MFRVLAIVAAVAVAFTIARADGGAINPQGIKDINELSLEDLLNAPVVTASGGAEEDRATSPANVFVVTRDDIAVHGWRSLAEILANVPGLYVIDDLVMPSLAVRGVTGGLMAGTRIVKVMIDGTSVSFRPLLSTFLGPELIPIEAVERVEVAKGPLSALYGANAFIATVNVITRSPLPALGAVAELHGAVINKSFGGGGSGLISWGGERASLLLAVSAERIDRSGLAQPLTFPTQTDGPLFHRQTQHDISQPLSALLRFKAGNDHWGQLTLDAGMQRLDVNGNFQLNSILTDKTRIVLDNFWSNARYEKHWSKLGLSASLGYSQGGPDRDYQQYLTGTDAFAFHPNYDYWAVNATSDVEYRPLGDQLSLKAGLDFEYSAEHILYYTETFEQSEGKRQPGDTIDLVGSNVSRQQGFYDIGAHLQAASTPFRRLPGLHITGNVRVDRIVFGPVTFPVEVSWRAAASYRWTPALVTKLIAGSAFQTPSGVLLFGQPGFGNSGNVVGNLTVANLPPLRPQTVTSVELVTSAQLFNHFAVEGGAYFQDLVDKIEFIQSGIDFVAANRGTRQALGLEASLHFSYRWFSAYGHVSLQDGLTNGSFDESTPLYPNYWGVIGADAHLPRAYLHLNAQVRAVGPRGASQSNVYLDNGQPYTLPAYADVDITLSSVGLHIFGPENEARLLVAVRNLIGETHAEPGFGGYDLPSLGRTFFFQVRQTF